MPPIPPGATAARKSEMRRKPSLEIRNRLADQVRHRRDRLGYTQAELAIACGLNAKYIAQVEQSLLNVTLSTLEALAKGLRCTESALLSPRSRR